MYIVYLNKQYITVHCSTHVVNIKKYIQNK